MEIDEALEIALIAMRVRRSTLRRTLTQHPETALADQFRDDMARYDKAIEVVEATLR